MYYFIQDSANEKGSAKCDITFGSILVDCLNHIMSVIRYAQNEFHH